MANGSILASQREESNYSYTTDSWLLFVDFGDKQVIGD